MTTTQAIDLQSAATVITTPLAVIHDTRAPVTTTGKTTLWDRIAIAVRTKGYSLSTERTYVHWAKRFTAWHGKRHPSTMGAVEVQAYLNHLAVDQSSAPSTGSVSRNRARKRLSRKPVPMAASSSSGAMPAASPVSTAAATTMTSEVMMPGAMMRRLWYDIDVIWGGVSLR